MKEIVSLEKISNTKCNISINVPKDIVDSKFNDFFEKVRPQAHIPGFRKGKAPVARLKQLFLSQAKASVAQLLIGEYYAQALHDNGITPVGNPDIKEFNDGAEYPGRFGFDNSFEINLTVDVLPKLDPTGYMDMELHEPDLNTEQMYNERILEYQKKFAEKIQITDRPAKSGDSVVIDFIGFMDGNKFNGGSAEGHLIECLGSGNMVPGFEEQIEGMTAGEKKSINITFPDDYHADFLASKNATFEITLHSITESKLSEVDDDLAMMVGFESVDEFKNNVADEVEKEKDARIKHTLSAQIVDKLIEANDFDVPEQMLKEEEVRLARASNNRIENMPDEALAELRKAAQFTTKRALILDAIYEKEDSIEIAPEELNELLEEHALANNQTKDELVSNLYNSGQMDAFVGILRVSKVFDFIIANSKKQ